MKIAGIFNFGNSTSIGGATLVSTTVADAQRWYNLEGQYSSISVAAEPGVTPDTLAARLKTALPHYADVKTSAQSVADNTKAISDAIGNVLRTILLAFGGVAVIVGAFIIFNAFSITVAQRIREFAMLRSLGATRRQVLASVSARRLRSASIASLLGIGAGVGIAKGINALFKAVGADIPTSGIVTGAAHDHRLARGRHRRGARGGARPRPAGDAGAPGRSPARGRHAAAVGGQPLQRGRCPRGGRGRRGRRWRPACSSHGHDREPPARDGLSAPC